MKKILALILATLMLLSFVACNNGDNKPEESTPAESTPAPAPAGPTDAELAANASLEKIANVLINKYAEIINVKAEFDNIMAEMPEEDRISYEKYLTYCLSVTPVEANAEWLMGLEVAPTGYSEAYCYQPAMMGQAFIGYIFRLEEGTNMEAFKKSLTDNCVLNWNICTFANTVVCENFDNIVYFSMMVVANDENPDGFSVEQKDALYNTFLETIKNPEN